MQNVVAGVLEGIQLTRIPIFQFAILSSSGEMEVSWAEIRSLSTARFIPTDNCMSNRTTC